MEMGDEMLVRYLKGRCSAEERKKIFDWAKETDNRRHLFELEQVWGLKGEIRFSDGKRLDEAWNRLCGRLGFEGRILVRERRRSVIGKCLKYAAVMVISFLLAANLLYLTREEPLAYNKVTVPKGQRVSLVLSDGTAVWLNAGSCFSYPARFSGKFRTVRLEGEAYFEVAPDSGSPFTVELSMLNVKVLGTKFNVKAYRGEPNRIILKEGAVEVATPDNRCSKKMAPNDEVVYTRRDGLILTKNSGKSNAGDWICGDLKFEDRPLQETVRDLERRYDVKIRIMDNILCGEHFTCRFRKDLGIGQVMELLKKTGRVNYRMKKDTVYLYENRNCKTIK